MNSLRIATMLACVLFAGSALADNSGGATIARQGNGHGAAPCMACHGADGGGQAAAGFPRLAGLPQAYLRKQLEDFANGTRANATMQPVAGALTDAERDAVVAYYAHLPIPTPAPVAAPTGDVAARGQTLATRGRWSDGLPACEQCHGPGGIGVGDHFPPLAAQSATYISNALQAWKQGARHNDPLQLMQHVATSLSDADIAAISAWYAAQPATPPKEPQS
ncbi:c-type cytochrome [Dyella acidiphila]|uniref:C-type cytochrome n=1 Tax=Dyella acidiphila TaxID=2775866 RepID=A0ABR9G7Z7_9GAMM|nr:c-type cytochrome [Dyella acidiphila]MBE1160170.1 c-type cytochrome [Dyella acidiphila]